MNILNYLFRQNPCEQTRKPPQNSRCSKFFAGNRDWSEGGKYDEAMIIARGRPYYCNLDVNPENKDFGWCQTQGDYYNMNDEDPLTKGWGFCSKDCFLSKNSANGNVLRHIPSTKVSCMYSFLQKNLK